jgi:hypothetical protein
VGVGVAPDVHEERGVVDGRALGIDQPQPIREAKRDRALPEHVLHRLTEAEVDPQRQRSDKLG